MADLLERYDVWKFLPMDQGGRLVQLSLIGSEADADIVAAVRRPGFFEQWGQAGVWDALEDIEREKSVWLNRWYFLPCFARLYSQTGDASYLRELLDFVTRWWSDNPLPEDLPAYFATRRYNWRDMQVAWRTHNLIWTYFLVRSGLDAKEDTFLRELIEIHGRVLLSYFGAQELHENNHQSHGALAMLYVGVLFPDFELSPTLVTRSLKILEHHLEHAFLPDGNSLELCPGYYPFIVSIFRDAYLLCVANKIPPPARSLERMRQFRGYLQAVAQPDGTVPPINDSSEMDARLPLAIFNEILGDCAEGDGSHWFEHSGQAVMRGGNWYAFLDAGPTMLWHWHGGKLGFHLWYQGEPILVDSGICNYDDPLRLSWYCTPAAHNTLLVDGMGDRKREDIPFAEKASAGCRVVDWESNEQYDFATLRHEGFPASVGAVQWVRHFLLLKDRFFLIVDRVQSEAEHDYTWLFHFSPGEVIPQGDGVRTAFARRDLDLLCATGGCSPELLLGEGYINCKGCNLRATVAHFIGRAASTVEAFALLPVGEIDGSVEVDFADTCGAVTVRVRNSLELITIELPALASASSASSPIRFSTIPPNYGVSAS